ncbi:MAG: hypothetical protein OZ921_00080 [Sorangiineae bacterium]|nr:hypothetical protein [Polyangiaceae bacterium]MEB2320881.1 hypothetical protein [Sorangiineae bacterium]
MRRIHWLLGTLALPPIALSWLSARAGDELARAVAVELSRVAAPLRVAQARAPRAEQSASAPLAPVSSAQARAPARARVGAKRRPARGLRISSAAVLRLASAGGRPSGRLVAPDGSRPAGLSLSGVGGLGVGLRDGDVLTSAGGAAATSPGAVIGAVVAARAAHQASISGVFWRDGEPWQLVVDQPYLEPREAHVSRPEPAESGLAPEAEPVRGREALLRTSSR